MTVNRINHRNSRERSRRALIVRVFALATMLLSTFEFSRAEEASEETPLAECAVIELAGKTADYEMPENVVLNAYQPPVDDSLSNYSRGYDGQWAIPTNVDRSNPTVKLLVLGPHQPTLIELSILLEGKPFTAAREKLIDELVDHASVESLVREAVSIPVPEGTEELSLDEDKPEEKKDPKLETISVDVKKKDSGESASADGESDKKSEEDSKDEKSSDKKEDKDDEPKEPEKPGVDVRSRQARTVAERLINYMTSTDVEADRDEIRWLLAEWTGGPALITLGPAMNWQRIGFAPLWNALDVDNDQNLSAAEIAAASERLSQADVDENSIIELEELFAVRPRSTTAPHSYPLIVVLDHETDWQQLLTSITAAYSRRGREQQGSAAASTSVLDRIAAGDTMLTAEDLELLLEESPQVSLQVNLGDEKSQVALTSATPDSFSSSEQLITVVRGAEYFEISAGQQKEAEVSEPKATQISIGAVVDGYPLYRLVDRNADRRLSPRECRQMKSVLAALDLNSDGQISEDEKPTAIRLAVSRGPYVHEMLAEPTSAQRQLVSNRQIAPAKPAASTPSWFTDMDRNRDGDLSRSEFLGNNEQFKQLDRDGDGLVGASEATE
jgi:Ca2+-binding EF-hand superfamily protein